MSKDKRNFEVLESYNQSTLFGYDDYFDLFAKLFEENRMPKVSLIEGQKGIGKSTFVYHFINFLLSRNEQNSYSLNEKTINKNNQTYQLLSQNIHPNFYLVNKKADQKNITIDEIRSMSSFLQKTSYNNNLKIVLIDDVEFLNVNSSNSLLKNLEEVNDNTFFFIICSNPSVLKATIKSRCILFKVNFNYNEKKDIFNQLLGFYNVEEKHMDISDYLFYDTPGNLLKYFSFLDKTKSISIDNLINLIFLYIQKYQKDKNNENIYFLSFFIERFYSYLIFNQPKSNRLFHNKNQILNKLNLLQKYNLDDKNIFIYIKNTLLNEKK